MTQHEFEFWSAELNPHTPSLDVHGLRVSEAIEEVDKFLDRQLIGKHAAVKIIHGSGMGALRVAIQKLLQTHTNVAAQHDSDRIHELAAVTYVILK